MTSRFLVSLLLVAALTLSSSLTVARADEPEQFTIDGIYYFGCDGSFVDDIKKALPLKIGERHSNKEQNTVKNKVFNAVWQVTRCSPTDVAIITTGNRTWTIYIGLPGRSVSTATYNPISSENIALELPKEGSAKYDEMMNTLARVLAEKGGCGEDDSKGYSLATDPDLRAKELDFRNWALQHVSEIKDVLKNATNPTQRSVAAEALGYLDPSKDQIDALVDASSDENAAVRNNATRAIACIASSSPEMAALIPPDKFIQMLNSGIWTDRNKGIFVITRLCKQDDKLLSRLQETALEALAEMACWDQGHAIGARFLLGKITGIPAARLDQLCLAGDATQIVKAYNNSVHPTASAHDSAPLAPSLPELGVILKDVFVADQSDQSRSKAFDCYKKLLSVKDKFKGTKLEPAYLDALAFESFHMGQIEATDKGNTSAAIKNFNLSVQHSDDARAAWAARHEPYAEKYSDDWAHYASATIAYLKGDLPQLESLQKKCGINDKTIARLLDGLRKSGTPSYPRDY